MQTISLDTHASSKAIRPAPGRRNPNLPPPMLSPGPKPGGGKAAVPTSAAAKPAAQAAAYAELDAMLIRDPNVGAVHGLRVALLFNAGLALSGLLAWEIWTLIAR